MSLTRCFPLNLRLLLDAWVGVIAYAFQIYFDFSGYSDMAVGLSRLFGFVIPKNFASPYLAESITDFWRRWHISLSTWLRDYLYVPLGGNRKGPRRTYINLTIVMLLGGLWHGANWTFVIWGTYHGVLLAFERWKGKETIVCGAASLGTGGHHLCAGSVFLGALSLTYVEPCAFVLGLHVGSYTAGRGVCSVGCANLHAASSDDPGLVRLLFFPIYRKFTIG